MQHFSENLSSNTIAFACIHINLFLLKLEEYRKSLRDKNITNKLYVPQIWRKITYELLTQFEYHTLRYRTADAESDLNKVI